jgi:acyl dehydratase
MTTPKPTRADGLWADDLTVGQTFTSGTCRMEESEMLDFAERYDPQPYHLDEDAAAGTFFNGLVASGWHTSAVTMRLSVEAFPVATGIVGAGGDFTWPSATVAGDELHVEMTIKDIRWSKSRPDQAILSVGVPHPQPGRAGAPEWHHEPSRLAPSIAGRSHVSE